MTNETRQCKNCSQSFLIEPDDFAFYEKIQVPPPTLCPECRMIRRMLFRNERALYKRTCALCQKNIITQYAPEKPFVVYCGDCYASDKWDAISYGRGYDFSGPFFEQFHNLMLAVPRRSLYQDFIERAEYTNHAVNLKNAYLIFGGHHYEDCAYCAQSFYLAGCVDVDFSIKSEQCSHSVNLRHCNRVHFSSYSEDCSDSLFLNHCRNCTNCIGCTNLRNASYHILNQSYSKEAYEKKVQELQLDSYQHLFTFVSEFANAILQYPRKHAFTRNAANSYGDDLENVRQCRRCFFVYESENIAYSFFVPTGAKDCLDVEHFGMGSELSYEVISGFNDSRVRFANRTYNSHDTFYTDDCYHSANLFGCIGLRKKEYCILNKQYTKEEYGLLINKIIEQMRGQFGEFFPSSTSPFAYNESMAHVYFPLSKSEALAKGYRWKDPEARNYQISMTNDQIPDHIKDVKDDIIGQIIECSHKQECNEQCTQAFRIIPQELQFYQRMNLPLPRLCPNCRHYQRLKQRNPLKLWHRKCMNQGCQNEFETSYAPDRPEIIYCESCYQHEVV